MKIVHYGESSGPALRRVITAKDPAGQSPHCPTFGVKIRPGTLLQRTHLKIEI